MALRTIKQQSADVCQGKNFAGFDNIYSLPRIAAGELCKPCANLRVDNNFFRTHLQCGTVQTSRVLAQALSAVPSCTGAIISIPMHDLLETIKNGHKISGGYLAELKDALSNLSEIKINNVPMFDEIGISNIGCHKHLTVRFNNEALTFINPGESCFTAFSLDNFFKLRSRYSQRLYGYFSSWKNAKHTQITYDRLRNLLFSKEVPKKYKDKYEFRTRILDKAINEINSKTDLEISYTINKSGMIAFSIRSKQNEQQTKEENANQCNMAEDPKENAQSPSETVAKSAENISSAPKESAEIKQAKSISDEKINELKKISPDFTTKTVTTVAEILGDCDRIEDFLRLLADYPKKLSLNGVIRAAKAWKQHHAELPSFEDLQYALNRCKDIDWYDMTPKYRPGMDSFINQYDHELYMKLQVKQAKPIILQQENQFKPSFEGLSRMYYRAPTSPVTNARIEQYAGFYNISRENVMAQLKQVQLGSCMR